jgi:hypothetical protein
LALTAPGAVGAQGKGQGVEARLLSPAVIQAAPGRIVSLSFRVLSKVLTEEEFVEQVEVPEGWQVLVPATSFLLPGNASILRLVAVSVPRTAAAGEYRVGYAVRSRRDYAILDSETATISVVPTSTLLLLVEQVPPMVMAGDAYEAVLRVVNRGNTTVTVGLTTTVAGAYTAVLDPATFPLAAGGSREVRLQVKTDPREPRSRKVPLQIEARGLDASGQVLTTAAVAIQPEIIALKAERPDLQRRLPARVTLAAVGGPAGSAFQLEASGAGYLDDDDKRWLAFSLRGPDAQDNTSLGSRDEYWADYETGRWGVQAGDQVYGLSYLTEYQRYGRGLDWHADPAGPWAYRVMGLHDRWQMPGMNEFGADLRYAVSGQETLQLNFLSKNIGGATTRPDGQVVSLESTTIIGRHRVTLEGAVSGGGNWPADQAFRLEAQGAIGRGNYYVHKLHAGADFAGAFYDADYTRLGVTAALNRSLQAHAGWSEWRTNLELRPERGAASREQLYQVGLTCQLSPAWYLSADYDLLQRRDAAAPSTFDGREQLQRYSLGYSSTQWSGRLETSLTRAEDRLTAEVRHPVVVTGFVGYRPSEDLAVSAFGSIADGGAGSGSFLLGSPDSAGAAVYWRPSQRLNANVSYTRYGLDSPLGAQDQVSGSVHVQLDNGHEITAQVRRSAAFVGAGQDTEYVLAYGIPFGIAVGKRTDIGELRGRVYDATDPGKRGLDNILIVCNQKVGATATKNGGGFSFGAVNPGAYMIQVQSSQPNARLVPEPKMPLVAAVTAGQTTMLEIGLVPAARISGRLAIYPPRNGNGDGVGNGSDKVAVPKALVELTRDDETLRTITDSRGDFLFDGLRPGRYHLKVYDDRVPAHYRLENPEQNLDVAVGADVKVELRIVPQERRIRVIDEGAIPVVK